MLLTNAVMKFFIELTRPQLKVLSSVFSNIVVVWLAALFLTRDPLVLTLNLVAATLCWHIAIKAEEALEL